MFSIFKIEAGEIKPIIVAGHNIATIKDCEEELFQMLSEQLEYTLEEKLEDGILDDKLYCLDLEIEKIYVMEEITEEDDELCTCILYNEKYYTLREI